ncbi:MAG: acyl-CoA synthetase (AMP-forming)/AMP-acid ligase II [Polaribacter sp.]|jgi:acyl-CoA synthetase (AMP-forming)/AMP-acid ligase II
MRTTPDERINEFNKRGWWGTDTLDSIFMASVAKHGPKTALVDQFNRSEFTDGQAYRLNFDELGNAAENLAADFYRHGLRRDDIVVIQLPNIAELAVLYLALGKLGVILSPVPIQYGRFELEKAIQLVEPAAFISLSNFKGKNFAREHGAAFVEKSIVFCFGEDAPEGAISLALDTKKPITNVEYQAYLAGLELTANDIFTICWTSGTTGQPKGVPRSHNMWIASAIASLDCAELRENETILNPFPLVNMAAIGGFLYCWLMRACTLVLHHPFDMNVFLKQIQEEKIAYTIAPPAVLTMLLNKREILDSVDLKSLRCIGSGSAPLSEYMVAGFGKDYGIEILNIFGSNEGICLTSGPTDLPDHAQRAQFFPRFGVKGLEWDNRAGDFLKTRLVNRKSGELVTERGVEGELEIWGATVFDGYYKSPEANAEVFSLDGYFRTGDVFEITDDGEQPRFYKYVGRCKDIIVRGGVNISPAEIDNELASHPKVAEVCVVGVDDDIMGERIAVAVVPKPGETVVLEDLTDYLKQKGMAVFKLPEKLQCVEALPYNATGKIQRRDVKKMID